ncbi:MAG: hypothetical protein JST88_09245 [Bacteroidetes bacterium]|nr:hypothetical protein [Bacteroidota bacterium]
MIGARTLFTDIVTEETFPSVSKGRSATLDAARNELLCHRYYYYLTFTDKRYEAIVTTLSDEFFLSNITIVEILKRYISTLQRLRNEKIGKTILAKKYPHFSW